MIADSQAEPIGATPSVTARRPRPRIAPSGVAAATIALIASLGLALWLVMQPRQTSPSEFEQIRRNGRRGTAGGSALTGREAVAGRPGQPVVAGHGRRACPGPARATTRAGDRARRADPIERPRDSGTSPGRPRKSPLSTTPLPGRRSLLARRPETRSHRPGSPLGAARSVLSSGPRPPRSKSGRATTPD